MKTYKRAMEVAQDMRERGYIVDPLGNDNTPAAMGKTSNTRMAMGQRKGYEM